jgi:hypothetical protein
MWRRIVAGSRDVRFDDLLRVTEAFGFVLKRVSSSHHILLHPAVPDGLNLQPDGRKAKPYQVRQLVALVEEHHLTLGGDGEP